MTELDMLRQMNSKEFEWSFHESVLGMHILVS
jgi:ubiquitin-protein ligase